MAKYPMAIAASAIIETNIFCLIVMVELLCSRIQSLLKSQVEPLEHFVRDHWRMVYLLRIYARQLDSESSRQAILIGYSRPK